MQIERLLDDGVLIRVEKPERMIGKAKLWVPDNAKRAPHELYQGVVMQTGPGMRRKDGGRNPVEVQIGDRVQVYWASMEMDVTERYTDGHEYRVVSERGIQCVLEA